MCVSHENRFCYWSVFFLSLTLGWFSELFIHIRTELFDCSLSRLFFHVTLHLRYFPLDHSCYRSLFIARSCWPFLARSLLHHFHNFSIFPSKGERFFKMPKLCIAKKINLRMFIMFYYYSSWAPQKKCCIPISLVLHIYSSLLITHILLFVVFLSVSHFGSLC